MIVWLGLTVVDPLEPDDPDDVGVVAAAPTKGLLSDSMLACDRSRLNSECASWYEMAWDWSVDASEDPDFQAPIHDEPELATSRVPPDHDWQLAHCTLATIVSPLTPLPARSVICEAVDASYSGSWWPVPGLGDTVTLPWPSWYMMKMLAPRICEPVPRATHEYVVGAEIWK